MKILALTDIHGAYKKALEIIKTNISDVLVVGGDLTTVGTVREAEEVLRSFQSIVSTVLCVAGNMDLPRHDDLFVRLGISINGRGVVIDGVGFCGASAAPVSPLRTPYEITEEEIAERLETGYTQIQQCARKILIPHAPPYGTRVDIIHSGIHVGSTAVRDFIEEKIPDVVICGHIHEACGQDSIGKTKIVNCGPAFNGHFACIDLSADIQITTHQLFI